jgi:hypothetical protein
VLQSEILWRQLNALRCDTGSSWHGEASFWLILLQLLQPAMVPKQCQLIIDFATKPPASHAGALRQPTITSKCAIRPIPQALCLKRLSLADLNRWRNGTSKQNLLGSRTIGIDWSILPVSATMVGSIRSKKTVSADGEARLDENRIPSRGRGGGWRRGVCG